MYARKGQVTPMHTHKRKKEDIIRRTGELALELWSGHPDQSKKKGSEFTIQVNGEQRSFASGHTLRLRAGERVTLTPGIYHAFWPECHG